jgi:hypothetical protein
VRPKGSQKKKKKKVLKEKEIPLVGRRGKRIGSGSFVYFIWVGFFLVKAFQRFFLFFLFLYFFSIFIMLNDKIEKIKK